MNALVLAQATEAADATAQATGGSGSAELIVFVIIGALALGSAVSMVLLRHPVHSALMLVVNFFTIAVLYAVNEAQFLATVQIIVYAGAIMVLFLFVIMLLGVAKEYTPEPRTRPRGQTGAAVVLGVVLFAALAIGIGGPLLAAESACPSSPAPEGTTSDAIACRGLAAVNESGNTEAIGALLFSRYVWPFEVVSVLLVIAAIGAMVLGRRDEDPADLIDRDVTFVPPETGVDEPDPGAEVEPAMIGQGNPAPSSEALPDEEER